MKQGTDVLQYLQGDFEGQVEGDRIEAAKINKVEKWHTYLSCVMHQSSFDS